ncbi:hypothetical protein JAAARDRAFT_89483, partial [Jaapia argillacea MUCL 33604]
FQDLWASGTPLIVTGLDRQFQLPWSPQYFIDHFGSQVCEIVDCGTDETQRSTVKEFFLGFSKDPDSVVDCMKLKVLHKLSEPTLSDTSQDWPPSATFQTTFPSLHEDFIRAVPFADYTRPDGCHNLAAHFPLNALRSDLGPKMYNAYADKTRQGTTVLHLDAADAINILLYATPFANGLPGGALWHIFAARDTPALRCYLRESTGHEDVGDPIHSQSL